MYDLLDVLFRRLYLGEEQKKLPSAPTRGKLDVQPA
jgi:hypothetical protein